MTKKQERMTFMPFIAIIVVIVAAVILFASTHQIDANEFTPERWKYGNTLERYKMFDSLMAQYDLYSMNRDEVVKLLGGGSISTEDRLYYEIESQFLHDPVLLMFVFDADGRVVEFREHGRVGGHMTRWQY